VLEETRRVGHVFYIPRTPSDKEIVACPHPLIQIARDDALQNRQLLRKPVACFKVRVPVFEFGDGGTREKV
jgi:hypothetical protein